MYSIVSVEDEYLFLVRYISFLLCCQIVCRAAAPSVAGESLCFIPQRDLYFYIFGHAASASCIYCLFSGVTLKSKILLLCALTAHKTIYAYQDGKSLG